MNRILIELPFPISVNNLKGYGKGNIYLKQKSKEYRQKVRVIIKREIRLHGYKKLSEQIRVKIIAYEPDNRVRDIDNIKKLLYDSITSASLWEDDSLIRAEQTEFQRNPYIKAKVFLEILPYAQ